MKATDLMIGDWVDVYHELPDESGFYKPLQVTGIHHKDGICFGDSIIESPWNDPEEFEEEIEPIPLTSEILEKNGYRNSVLVDDYFIAYGVHYNMDSKCIMFGHEYGSALEVRCEYVHELQHALRLCGIDKEIII